MSTAHSLALSKVYAAIAKDPEQVRIAHRYLEKLRDGFYDREWVDVLFQSPFGSNVRPSDAAAFGMVWVAIHQGAIVHARILVGKMPAADRDLEHNASLLNALPPPFQAKLWCGNREHDGLLEWSERITLAHTSEEEVLDEVTLKPGAAPLEVGYTTISKTLAHLNQDRVLARWPYGQRVVTLLALTSESPLSLTPARPSGA
jgi:hypothetical protein